MEQTWTYSDEDSFYPYEDVFSEKKRASVGRYTVAGIDIGSRQGKGVLMTDGKVYVTAEPTGFSMQKTADHLIKTLLQASGKSYEDIRYIVGTGYGRVSMQFKDLPNQMLTEIFCHGLGAAYLADNVHTILDIGGQDSKIIKIDSESGQVQDFAMNDKCAAGTGRFLERAAELLGYEVGDIGAASLEAKNPYQISSQCVVFAESEIVSARAQGIDTRDILAGVHSSVINRVSGLFKRIGMNREVMFTGGVSNNAGMRKALEDFLGTKIAEPSINPVFAGALGAALYAQKQASHAPVSEVATHADQENKRVQIPTASVTKNTKLDLSRLKAAVAKAESDYISHSDGVFNAAHMCAYTPIELLEAMGVRHIKLQHTGTKEELAAGEEVVSQIACDYTKSLIGGFAGGYPLYKAVDKVYAFYTCSFMAAAMQAVGAKYKPVSLYMLPKIASDGNSGVSEERIERYLSSLHEMVSDLEEKTGHSLDKEHLRKVISRYNLARKKLCEISDIRIENPQLLSGSEFREIAASYYKLPLPELLIQLDGIQSQLYDMLRQSQHTHTAKSSLRIMLTGGIATESDNKIEKILTQLGADVVVEDHCGGYTPFMLQVEETYEDPLLLLTRGYLGKAPCANIKPMSKRCDTALDLAKKYHPDGIIYQFMQFCPTYGMAKQTISQHLEQNGFPVLDVAVNYSDGDEGQIRTRLEAFLEMLVKGEEKRYA